jgi:hypothetical protein
MFSAHLNSWSQIMLIMHWYLVIAIIPYVLCEQSLLSNAVSNRIIDALTRALQFFASNINEVNLDAGIGTRIAADQLRPYVKCQHCQMVKKLVDLSDYVTERIGQSVRYRQPAYYAQLSILLEPGMFSTSVPFEYHRNEYDRNKHNIECSSSIFMETYSDQCLHALTYSKCADMESCTKLLDDPYACRYLLTHQIFYSILAKQSSCTHRRLSLEREHRLMLRMFDESRAIARGNFSELNRDLFMEQIAFAGLLGWADFFDDIHWFNVIIDWQHPIDGCYGNDSNHQFKREEMQMSHYCLSHRTSVAIAALAQMLRFMISSDIYY